MGSLGRFAASLIVAAGVLASGCGTGSPRFVSHPQETATDPSPDQLRGIASYYADEFHGRLTSNGETFDMNALTAAHRTLPFNSLVRVTNLDNQRSVVVRINDRGPFKDERVIDLSLAAAKEIGMIGNGTAPVKLEVLKLGASGD